MRVIAGEKGGLVLEGAHGKEFRPTTQLVKGAIFNSLYGELQGSVILDLFAGSGGLGIEGLSRGAKKAVFVENDSRAMRALKANLDNCGFGPEEAEAVKADALRFMRKAVKEGHRYDIIVADPPYGSDLCRGVLEIVSGSKREVFRIMILETDEELEEIPESSVEKYKVKNFGQTRLNYFRHRK